jgi:hypothetical protein
VREFAFELALCAHLETRHEWVVSRQLGAAVASPGSRIVDVVGVEPGPAFEERAALTDRTVPAAAVESSVGPGRWRAVTTALPGPPERAREVAEAAVEAGFFERERRDGVDSVRQVARYPDDWFGRVVGVENKPDLGRPGDLARQLRTDVSLGLLDEAWLATESYVTGAHLNRIPEQVGVWRFHPETGEREVVREAAPLDVAAGGIEVHARDPARADVAVATPAEKARARRRLAERAYGKGWRSTFDLPACARVAPDSDDAPSDDTLPYCAWKGRVVDPARECGPDCAGHEPADPPTVDAAVRRDVRTPWVADPDGHARRQSGLGRYLDDD